MGEWERRSYVYVPNLKLFRSEIHTISYSRHYVIEITLILHGCYKIPWYKLHVKVADNEQRGIELKMKNRENEVVNKIQ